MKTDSNTTRTEIEFSNVQPIWRFCFLYIITVGLYSIAWHHKQWTFIRNRGNLAIPPGAWIRGIFSGFFIYLLCRRISALAEDRGYEKKLSAFGLTALVWFLGSLANLPDPFRLLTVLIVIPHIPILKAVNYYWEQEEKPSLPVRTNFTRGELVWVGIGAVLWIVTIIDILLRLKAV